MIFIGFRRDWSEVSAAIQLEVLISLDLATSSSAVLKAGLNLPSLGLKNHDGRAAVEMNVQHNEEYDLRTELKFIYDTYRTAYLNRKYYGWRLNTYQRYNTIMEIAIAIGATGSGGVAGLAVWGSISGQYAWLWVSGTATVLGVIKPILQLGQRIENYTKLYVGHGTAYLTLKSMVQDIEVSRSVPPNLKEQYSTIRKQLTELGGNDDLRPNRKAIKSFEEEVREEIPIDSLWYPDD